VSQPFDSIPGWLQQIGGVVGAGGGLAIALKFIDRAFGRADKRDDLEVGLRTSILERLAAVEKAYREQGEELEAMRLKNTALEVRLARAETREQWTRNRYHRLAGWLQTETGIPSPPAWIFEDIPREAEEAPEPPAPARRPRHQKPPETAP
jgi:hypothetical protein